VLFFPTKLHFRVCVVRVCIKKFQNFQAIIGRLACSSSCRKQNCANQSRDISQRQHMSLTSEKGRQRVYSRASRARRHPRTQPNSIATLPRLQATELASKRIETDALNHAALLHWSFEVNCLGIFEQSAYIATLAPSRSCQGMSRMIFKFVASEVYQKALTFIYKLYGDDFTAVRTQGSPLMM
jgi:hypothetical protein